MTGDYELGNVWKGAVVAYFKIPNPTEDLRKTTEYANLISRSPCRDSKPGVPNMNKSANHFTITLIGHTHTSSMYTLCGFYVIFARVHKINV
jgi:hypothetical protein